VTLQQKDPAMERILPEHLHRIERQKRHPDGRVVLQDGKPAIERVLFPALYHAHVDLSKSGDATGLVIAHNIGSIKVQRFDPKALADVEETKPIIRVDLVLRIVAPRHGEIDIPRVRGVLYELNRHYGMQFGKVTFDTYASQESVKTMKDEGFDADILSMDKDMAPYETLRTAIYDERVLCYYDPVLERELIQLERGEKKIDHPSSHNGSKDLADALAGAVTNCETSWRAGESMRGLFQTGIVEHAGEMSQEIEERQARINANAVEGKSPTEAEENALLFADLDRL
jgi:hypothetical protein